MCTDANTHISEWDFEPAHLVLKGPPAVHLIAFAPLASSVCVCVCCPCVRVCVLYSVLLGRVYKLCLCVKWLSCQWDTFTGALTSPPPRWVPSAAVKLFGGQGVCRMTDVRQASPAGAAQIKMKLRHVRAHTQPRVPVLCSAHTPFTFK